MLDLTLRIQIGEAKPLGQYSSRVALNISFTRGEVRAYADPPAATDPDKKCAAPIAVYSSESEACAMTVI